MKKQKLPIVLLLLVGILSSLAIVTYIGKNFLVHPENTPPRPPSSTISSEIDENDTTWKTYTNEKIGVSFEYPNDYVIQEQEGDFRDQEDYPYSKYNFSIAFTHKDSLDDQPYPIPEFYFDVFLKEAPGFIPNWYPNLKPSEQQIINGDTWDIYLPMTCEKDAPDKTKCDEQSGNFVLKYAIKLGDYRYSYNLYKLDDRSPVFQRILHSTSISSPNLD